LRSFALLLAAVGLLAAVPAAAEQGAAESAAWYRRDAAGLAYEPLARAAALRAEWALEIRSSPRPGGGRTETKTIHHRGEPRRTVVSVLTAMGAAVSSETTGADGYRRAERYDARGRLIEERFADEDGQGFSVRFSWSEDRLLRASAYASGAEDGDPLWTDTYRYERSGALRSVDRSPEGASFSHDSRDGRPRVFAIRSASGELSTTVYDGAGREVESVRLAADGKTRLSAEWTSYGEPGTSGQGASSRRAESASGRPSELHFDAKGRVVKETIFGADGKTAEEVRPSWKGDRLASVEREIGGRLRRTDYGYDARGDRAWERNYLDGVLERTVRREGRMEIEELYRGGVPALRAVYENGSLVSEERIRPMPGGAR